MELRLINYLCRNYIVSSTYSVYVNKPTSILVPHRSTQVPQDEWGGYPGGGKDDEIPCRRMRSSSYVKAMGDEESGESDSSPKTSPQRSVRPDALVKAIIRPRDLLDSQRYDTLCLWFPLFSSMLLFIHSLSKINDYHQFDLLCVRSFFK